MTWQTAKAAAADRVEFILTRFNPPPGATIRLAQFEDEACYLFLKGPNEWPFEFHRMVIRACARDLSRRGFKVQQPILKLVDYWNFLETENEKDSPANRAAFISFKTK